MPFLQKYENIGKKTPKEEQKKMDAFLSQNPTYQLRDLYHNEISKKKFEDWKKGKKIPPKYNLGFDPKKMTNAKLIEKREQYLKNNDLESAVRVANIVIDRKQRKHIREKNKKGGN